MENHSITGRRVQTIARSSRPLWLAALCMLWLALFASGSQAQALEYSRVDRATVRVFAFSGGQIPKRPKKGKGAEDWIPLVEMNGGHGTGLLISEEGLILTAAHVVENARYIAVKIPGSQEVHPARLVYKNRRKDYAFIAISGTHKDFIALPETPAELVVRQPVFAVGYPIEANRERPQSSRGIVSGVNSEGELQLDMNVNPGNSGGPLLDAQDNVLGIIVDRGRTELGIQGIAYAVTLDRIAKTFRALSKKSDKRWQDARARLPSCGRTNSQRRE